jgi:phosphatidylserine/phosphatidylglycerophosphate/cardiolipin synthase-like enzyme
VPAQYEVIESTPVETPLDDPNVRDAHIAWLDAFRGAQRSIDIAQFYVSNAPQGGGRLEAVLQALEAAVKRGVVVRLLVDRKFLDTYPQDVARMARAGVDCRVFDATSRWGGVMHAKYFVVDGTRSYVGSQNFDYRSLEHILELGVWVQNIGTTTQLERVFRQDWQASGPLSGPLPAIAQGVHPELAADEPIEARCELPKNGQVTVSPRVALGEGDAASWDLRALVQGIACAKHSVRVHVLTYKLHARNGQAFQALDLALRSAAARGVEVTLLVSHWGKNEPALAELAALPNVRVGIFTVPPWSGGEVPFARVSHAKFMIIDEAYAWVGTSNWERDYFYASRNVGLWLDDRAAVTQLSRRFGALTSSRYVAWLTR